MAERTLVNPFSPGAGQRPPYLAGRKQEQQEFRTFLAQPIVRQNIILTGLRGVGKTVLLDTFKDIAQNSGWLWTGADFSEATSVSEERLATRLVADISLLLSNVTLTQSIRKVGFGNASENITENIRFDTLMSVYKDTPGLISDKLKATLLYVWRIIKEVTQPGEINGIIFAYDEAQTLGDRAKQNEYPLSLLLEIFQSLQRQEIPFMLILTGLQTLFPKLVGTRTYAERMFHVITIDKLSREESFEAITKPVEENNEIQFGENVVETIIDMSGGYPYFIQFICRETFEAWISLVKNGHKPIVPVDAIIKKLDDDFFQGRWSLATDRQKELLYVISHINDNNTEFTLKEIVTKSREMNAGRCFQPSYANQLLSQLIEKGLVYKTGMGKYRLAVHLFANFVLRQDVHFE